MITPEQAMRIADYHRYTVSNPASWIGLSLERMLLNETTALFAMHEAEKAFNQDQLVSYVQELKAVIGKQWEEAGDLTVYVAYFRADAGQRATAYINTINKLSK